MAIRNVVQVGDDILRKKCFEVENFDEKLWQLLDDMKDTLEQANGAGLAAPQVGILRRAVVVLDDDEAVLELVKGGRLHVCQQEIFGDIDMEYTGEGPLEAWTEDETGQGDGGQT